VAQNFRFAELEKARMEAPIVISSGDSSRMSDSRLVVYRGVKLEGRRERSPVAGPSNACDSSSLGSISDAADYPPINPSSLLMIRSLPGEVECPGNPSPLKIKGMAWMALKTLYDLGRLSLTEDDVRAIADCNPTVYRYLDVFGVALATVQTLAGLPTLRETLSRWAEEQPRMIIPDLSGSLGFSHGLRPWEETPWWNFDTWVLLMEIIPKFLALDPAVSEEEFLQSLHSENEQATPSQWRVLVMVTSLFAVKKAPWFWPFLL